MGVLEMLGSRRFRFVLLLLVALALAFGVWGSFLRVRPPEAQEAELLLNRTLNAESYCYTLQAVVDVSGAQRSYFDLVGEKSGANAHVAGTVLNTELELYFIDGALYQRNGADTAWQAHAVADIGEAAQLFAELAPAAAFSYSTLRSYTYDGVVETAAGKRMQLTMQPEATGWVADYFADVTYTLLLDKRGKQLQQATLTATSRENSAAALTLHASFSELGEEIVLTPPL